jgi:hypothetical protein
MITKAFFVIFALLSIAYLLADRWQLAVAAAFFAVLWVWSGAFAASARIDRILADDIRPDGRRARGPLCRCDWLGTGTPEHETSALCVSLRPNADRDGEAS